MITINITPDSYDTSYAVTLDNTAYVIRLRWSDLSNSWYLYISNNATTFFYKTRLTNNRDLLAPVRYLPYCPQGLLFVADTMKEWGRPGRNDFGEDRRFRLFYMTEDERNAVAA